MPESKINGLILKLIPRWSEVISAIGDDPFVSMDPWSLGILGWFGNSGKGVGAWWRRS